MSAAGIMQVRLAASDIVPDYHQHTLASLTSITVWFSFFLSLCYLFPFPEKMRKSKKHHGQNLAILPASLHPLRLSYRAW